MSYFNDDEIACSCCGANKLADGFLDELIALREVVNHPMSATSICRCKKHNTEIGGKDGSFHICNAPDKTGVDGACAADISVANWSSQKRWKFVNTAMQRGWSVGINWQKNFIHIDRRSDYPGAGWPEPVLFPY